MYEFDRATPVTVALHVRSGVVDLRAEERGTIEVEVTAFDNSDSAREIASRTQVLLEDDTLLIQTPGSESWSWRRFPKLRVSVKVPAGSALAGKSAAADVRTTGPWSTIQLEVSSADVEVAETTGDTDLNAASGDLTVGRVGGSMRLRSGSGDLRIGDVTGDVNADTASGDIRMASAGGSARVTSASGDIEIGSLRRGRAEVRTASGDVQVGVAAGTGVWLDLDTSSGKSVSDLTAHGPDAPGEPATLELRVRTGSGDIRVHRSLPTRTAA